MLADLPETRRLVPLDPDLPRQHGPATCIQERKTALQGKVDMTKYRAGSSRLMQFSFILLFLCNLILILIHSKQPLRLKYAADLASAVRSACWHNVLKLQKHRTPSKTSILLRQVWSCQMTLTAQPRQALSMAILSAKRACSHRSCLETICFFSRPK